MLDHAHEPPWIMGLPLDRARARLAVGRRGLLQSLHRRTSRPNSGAARSSTPCKPRRDHDADLGDARADAGHGGSASPSPGTSTSRNPLVPFGLAKRFRGAYLFLSTNGISTSSTTSLFVRPAKRLGRFLWKTGDGKIIDGFGPDGVAARVIDVTNRVVRLQTGYVYHYAFAMLIGVALLVTCFMFCGGGLRDELWLADPLHHHLPAAARRAADRAHARRRRERRPQCPLHRAVDDARHLRLSLLLWCDFDPTTAQFQFVEQRAWLGGRSATTWASTAFPCRS